MINLVEKSRSLYRIVIPADAHEKILLGAKELARYILKISGAALPIVSDSSAPIETELCLGPVNRPGYPGTGNLKNDGYAVTVVDQRIFLAGDGVRGPLYAAYGFLEEKLGCRFFSDTVEHIPQRPTLWLDPAPLTRQSPFAYRETSWYTMMQDGMIWKRGLNGAQHHDLDRERSDGLTDVVRYSSFGHTLFDFVSPDEYFDTHPEYFSMVDGVRIKERTQLCLTNPEVLAITKKKLRQLIKARPDCTVFSLSQMDWYNPCQCPQCAKVDAEEGAHSGTLLRFVNACAEDIAQDYPHILIDTFAYQYTRQAPRLTRPAPNVSVRVCSIECCFAHPLRECHEIASFKTRTRSDTTFQKDLLDWSRIADHLVVWDYTTNFQFYYAPFPNLQVLQPNVQFFRDCGADGLFEQGNSFTPSGELGELRAYLITKLMWEPDGDTDLWTREFLTAYYGQAAGPVGRYVRMLSEYTAQSPEHIGIYQSPKTYITDEQIPVMDRLWDEAEALADNEDVLARVQRSRLQLRMVKLHRKSPEDADYASCCEALIADIKAHGVTSLREGQPLEATFELMRTGSLPGVKPEEYYRL
jgi:hypothetical protein